MTPERWRQLEALYHAALARPANERPAFLAEVCAGDNGLRREVESLLDSPTTTAGFLSAPAIAMGAQVLSDSAESLLSGRQLGVYRLMERIGSGGMGDVYRARDTRLSRDVAIKILPPKFTADVERLARFEREARVLASLNHPNIATIHGIEESDGVRAIVLELVQGETLAQRISQGPIPITSALAIARQIADALDAAHEKGIIHRDLKPANIKVTVDGSVKVLDFGLATVATGDSAGPALSESPTMTVGRTREGALLGTPSYMSPEQALGRSVDKRSDIWAFGCVLYEMLSGKRAFGDEEMFHTLAAVVRAEPDWSRLPPETPVAIRRLLHRCLEKDPRERTPDIRMARLEIKEAQAAPPEVAATTLSPLAPRTGSTGYPRVVGLLIAMFCVLLAGGFALSRAGYFDWAQTELRTYRFPYVLPEGVYLPGTPASRFALSPDGRSLAFVAVDASLRQRLWLRRLDALDAQPLPETDGAGYPFWSPDSRFVAFVAAGKLKKIDVAGGPPVPFSSAFLGSPGAWNQENVILMNGKERSPLYRVSAAGGTPVPVVPSDASLGDVSHLAPFFLPDGQHFLYTAVGSEIGGLDGARGVYIGSINAGEKALMLLEGASHAKYAQGYLLFLREATLMAQPFDVSNLKLSGHAVSVVDHVDTGGFFKTLGAYSVSETGVLVYQDERAAPAGSRGLVWLDRTGKQVGALGDANEYEGLRLSPDGSRAVVTIRAERGQQPSDLWLFNLVSGLPLRFTSDSAGDQYPIWSPDGTRVVFASARKGSWDLYEKPSNGASAEQVLLEDNLDKFPSSWSPDGQYLLYEVLKPRSLRILPLSGDRKPRPISQMSFGEEAAGQFSPDGRWVAYQSNESGQFEVYVAPFSRSGERRRISTSGGATPRWRRDGTEIFYLAPLSQTDRVLMAASVNGKGSSFEVGVARRLFQTRVTQAGTPFDVSADGQRFLVITSVDQPRSAPLTVIVNWTDGLKK